VLIAGAEHLAQRGTSGYKLRKVVLPVSGAREPHLVAPANYNISFSEMNKLAEQANSKKSKLSLADMRKQVALLKTKSVSKVKKQQSS